MIERCQSPVCHGTMRYEVSSACSCSRDRPTVSACGRHLTWAVVTATRRCQCEDGKRYEAVVKHVNRQDDH